MANKKKTILVFGETGVGKSSLIKSLIKQDFDLNVNKSNFKLPKSSTQATSCSLNIESFESTHFEWIDTTGLNESDRGKVGAFEAMIQLITFFKKSIATKSIHLLIMVARQRITETMRQNYEFFVETLFSKQVPTLLVVTGCETEAKPEDWIKNNLTEYKNQNFCFKDIISTSFIETLNPSLKLHFEEINVQSAKNVIKSIQNHCPDLPIELFTDEKGLKELFIRLWNKFCIYFNFPSKIWIESKWKFILSKLSFLDSEKQKIGLLLQDLDLFQKLNPKESEPKKDIPQPIELNVVTTPIPVTLPAQDKSECCDKCFHNPDTKTNTITNTFNNAITNTLSNTLSNAITTELLQNQNPIQPILSN